MRGPTEFKVKAVQLTYLDGVQIKKVAVSGGTTSARFGFAQEYGRRPGVRYLCKWLGVSRSGYYDGLKREASDREKEDIELLHQIRKVHSKSRETYGSPRVH